MRTAPAQGGRVRSTPNVRSGHPRIAAAHLRAVRAEYLRLGTTPTTTGQLARWIGPNGVEAVLASIERVAERRATLTFDEVERELRADSWRARRAARAEAEAYQR